MYYNISDLFQCLLQNVNLIPAVPVQFSCFPLLYSNCLKNVLYCTLNLIKLMWICEIAVHFIPNRKSAHKLLVMEDMLLKSGAF